MLWTFFLKEEKIMKEMIYKKIPFGSFPDEIIPEDHKLYFIYDEFDPKIESVCCHGGITCISIGGILKGNGGNYREGHWIGWDYLHPGDYEANMHPLGRKWTTKEILDDVKNVIKQLVQM